MIILFERSAGATNRIRKFLRKHSIFSCVVVDFNLCADDLTDGEGEFYFDKNGFFKPRNGLADELNNLRGPIILHGGCRPGNKILLSNKAFSLAKREDTGWVEKIQSQEFFSLYWRLYVNIIFKQNNIHFAK